MLGTTAIRTGCWWRDPPWRSQAHVVSTLEGLNWALEVTVVLVFPQKRMCGLVRLFCEVLRP